MSPGRVRMKRRKHMNYGDYYSDGRADEPTVEDVDFEHTEKR